MDSLNRKFNYLANKWSKKTFHLSSLSQKQNDVYMQQIIAMGTVVVPLIIKRMKNKPDFWFQTLKELTGYDPVKVSHYGDLKAMSEDWLEHAEKFKEIYASQISLDSNKRPK